MFVLIEYNENYSEILKIVKKSKLTPIILFEITLNNKNQIKQDLEKLRQLKDKLQPQYSAIKITLEKIENSTVGTISFLKNYFNFTIGMGGLNKVNRFFLEQTQVDFLLDPQNVRFKSKIDFIHHLNSGINHILCMFAKEKQTNFLFSLNFTSGRPINIAKEIGRINQNIKFANKFSIPTHISFIINSPTQIKSKFELENIYSLFDMSTKQKQDSLNLLENIIKRKANEKSGKVVCDGIEFM